MKGKEGSGKREEKREGKRGRKGEKGENQGPDPPLAWLQEQQHLPGVHPAPPGTKAAQKPNLKAAESTFGIKPPKTSYGKTPWREKGGRAGEAAAAELGITSCSP